MPKAKILIFYWFLKENWEAMLKPKADQMGTKWDQMATKWDQVGTNWDQVGTKRQNVDFSLVLKGE